MSFRIRVAGAFVVMLAVASARVGGQSPFNHQGLDLLHRPDSALPNQQVDPASGTLTVVATDLVLPGNAGLNLAIQRVDISAVFPDYDSGASTALEEDSWAGIGWKLHFGRIIDATPAGTFTSVYVTDVNGSLASLTYPSGRLVTDAYDAENRLTSFNHPPPGAGSATPFAHSFTYGASGRLASYMTGAVMHSFTYEGVKSGARTRSPWRSVEQTARAF